ncbi:MAG: glycerol-3-phosphate 1-O-acyltransferase PlsY [Chloroflexota bacterium]
MPPSLGVPAALVIGYLLGSVPSGVIAVRVVLHRDVRNLGSGNIGAANVARNAGRRVGIAVGLLDGLKGVLAVVIAGHLGGGLALEAAGLGAVLGHDFSLFLRFRGGKGVATSLGVGLALAPVAAIAAAIVWLVVWLRWGYSSSASLLALAALPAAMAITGQPPGYLALTIVLLVLAVVKHRANIARLLNGTEPGRKRRLDHGD